MIVFFSVLCYNMIETVGFSPYLTLPPVKQDGKPI